MEDVNGEADLDVQKILGDNVDHHYSGSPLKLEKPEFSATAI